MTTARKVGVLAGSAVAPVVSSLAQESTPNIDLTAAGNAADALGEAVSDLVTGQILTNVLLVVAAGLAIWGVFLVVRYVRRGAK